MLKLTLAGAALLALTACQEQVGVADIKGACDAFERPDRPVLGKRKIDQRWIDRAVETGVTVCGWPRPKSEDIVRTVTS